MGAYLGVYHRLSQISTLFFHNDGNKKAVKRTNLERFTAIFWSRIRDSNPPPTAWEALQNDDYALNIAKMVAYWELIISTFSFPIQHILCCVLYSNRR